jgi:hypothetical protein
VCREGEAFALAAGLYLGGKKPIVASMGDVAASGRRLGEDDRPGTDQ